MTESNETRWRRLRRRLAEGGDAALPAGLRSLARAAAGVEETAMTHDECRSWLPSVVDAEMGGLPVARLYPQVKRHLDQCPTCEAEYAQMLELAMAEEAGELPTAVAAPLPDLSFARLSLNEVVRGLAERLVAATQPALQADLRQIMDPFFRQVDQLGGRFQVGRPLEQALGAGPPERVQASRYLAATHLATQTALDTLTPAALDGQAGGGQLRETLRRLAEKAGRAARLSQAEAQAFAAAYADLGAREVETLKALMTERGG